MINFFYIAVMLVLCSGCGNDYSDKSSGLGLDTSSDIYSVTDEDMEMNAAMSKARQTIHEFDEALASGDSMYSNFAVKKRYVTNDDGGEHMWVAGISIENGNYKGYVNNDAEKTTEVKYGDTVIVSKDEITDWMYLDNDVLRGGYTIRAIRNRLSKKERIEMDESLGFRIED